MSCLFSHEVCLPMVLFIGGIKKEPLFPWIWLMKCFWNFHLYRFCYKLVIRILLLNYMVWGFFLCACYRNGLSFDMWVFKKNIWSKEFSNINGKPISFRKSGGLLCYGRCGKNVYLYTSKASSTKGL